MFAPSKKRPMMPAQSPMTRMTQELGDALPDTSSSSSPMDMAVGSQPAGSQHVYCTPDFGEGDFCTPVDQVHDLQWSQKENEEPAGNGNGEAKTYVCPPTPGSVKRRRTKPQPVNDFLYDLPEDAETDQQPSMAPLALPRSPNKRVQQAPAKPVKQRTLQESWHSSGGPSSAPTRPVRAIGAKACNSNPFERDSLTARELRTPSRPLPVLDGSGKSSRYLKDFEELDMLGKGDFGVVHSARSRVDGSLYAVKRGRLQQRTSDKNSAYYEVFAMSSLAGVSNVVRYHSSWVEDDELYIQMELCKHTFLSQCKKGCPLAEQTALEVLHNIGGALCGMHKRGIAHMDVKPDNIYVALDGTYRLGDLGLAASEEQMREGGVEPVEGDGRYAAPEAVMCLSQGGCERLSPCDIYSLGACIFELCTGRAIDWSSQPFSSVREGETVELVGYSAGLCLLLSCMLNPDPAERCTAEEVWKEAGRLVGGGGIEGELARERERVAHLEKLLAAVSSGGNGNGVGTPNASMMDDAEPMGSQESPYRPLNQQSLGSQESPFRPLAQRVPASPVLSSPHQHSFLRHHIAKRDGVRKDFANMLPPSPVIPGPGAGCA